MTYPIALALVTISIVMMFVCTFLAYKKGIKKGDITGYNRGLNKVTNDLKEELLNITNTGFYEQTYDYTNSATNEKIPDVLILSEVEELYRSVDGKKSKVKIKNIQDVYNKTEQGQKINSAHFISMMVDYVDTKDIKWFTNPKDRKNKIQKLISKLETV
jgi:hypothetical protein